ncbi:MAG TPA: metallophosphoesterase, partial [Terriglobales bacterium]|nr:metallophosphoesterase [Terriglobales bacterium]
MMVFRSWLSVVLVLSWLACDHSQSRTPARAQPVDLQLQVSEPFRFVAYGDTRFTDPNDAEASNPTARRILVQAIADAHPAFVSVGGDLPYNGNDPNDWKVWDAETSIWRQNKIPVYPAIGNHELHGDLKIALANYFQRFPDLKESRYYSVRIANTMMLVLDTNLGVDSAPQAQWLAQKLDSLPADIDFVFLVFHHPPYTSSSDKYFGAGHSARRTEQELANRLEARQQGMRARIVVFSGHVHNYERHEHGGITYFVTGGGGAHAYPIERAPGDPYQSKGVNY